MLNKSFRNVSVLTASAMAVAIGFSQPVQASEPFIGQIETFGFNFAPRGWAFCDGQLLSIASNTALFSLLGTTYGGDGRTTFGLPDLRGRTAIHPGTGPGLSQIRWGQKGGAQSHTLTAAQLASHSHAATATLKGNNSSGDEAIPEAHSLASKSRTNIYQTAAPDVNMHSGSVTVTVSNTGNNQSFSLRDPYLGIYHAIAMVGVFPSRN